MFISKHKQSVCLVRFAAMTDKEIHDEAAYEFDTVHFDDGLAFIVRGSSDNDFDGVDPFALYPDHWIATNRDNLWQAYDDISEVSKYSTLFDELNFGNYCLYMEYVARVHPQDEHNWADGFDPKDHEILQHGRRNPTFKQWTRHYIVELSTLFTYLCNGHPTVDFGSFELFMHTCYDNSSSALRIPYT